MNKERLKNFKKIFEAQKKGLLFNKNSVIGGDFTVNEDDRYDEVDLATTDIEQSMRLRLRNREALYLEKIESALERIAEGTFGECEGCGEDIEIRRLEARPTATLCVGCKEKQENEERREMQTAGRRLRSGYMDQARRFA